MSAITDRITEVVNEALKGNWPLADYIARKVEVELHLTEEHRTLTDGWIQPMRNATYRLQALYEERDDLTPPPAVITEETRFVSPWIEQSRRVETYDSP